MLIDCRLQRARRRRDITVRIAIPEARAHDTLEPVEAEVVHDPPRENLACGGPAYPLVIVRRIEVTVPDKRRPGAKQTTRKWLQCSPPEHTAGLSAVPDVPEGDRLAEVSAGFGECLYHLGRDDARRRIFNVGKHDLDRQQFDDQGS
jgi:hypothetical protein